MTARFAFVVLVAAAPSAFAQSAAPEIPATTSPTMSSSTARDDAGHWTAHLSLLNMYDGNINHDPTPIRSYGVVPAATIGYQSFEERFVAQYEIAANQFTGTNDWDRISHGVQAAATARAGKKWRFEGGGQATWKGSSEDRELSNEYGVSGRASYRMLNGTRLIALGMLRYKDYPDDPETSGFSPYVGAKLDQRLAGSRRLVFGYKYEERRSHLERNQYHRHGYSVEFSTPFLAREGRLTFEGVMKTQTYRRLIKVGSIRELRQDLRSAAGLTYEYPLSPRVVAAWQAGFERRGSNDEDKRFFAPTFGMNVGYRWR